MIEKMSRLVPRNSNYCNVDRVIDQARYDEEKNIYHLPEPTREDVQLPQMGNLPITTNGRMKPNGNGISSKPHSVLSTTEYEDDFIVSNENPTTNYEEMERSYERYPNDTQKSYERYPNDTQKSYERYPNDTQKSYERYPNDTQKSYERHPNDTQKSYERHPNDNQKSYERHPNDTQKSYERYYDNTDKSFERYSDDNQKRYERYYDDNDKRYDQYHELAEKPRIRRQEILLNESSLLQRVKRPLQTNDNDFMNRRLNPYDAPARLSRKYGSSSDKQ
jgi:hypothetical protein